MNIDQALGWINGGWQQSPYAKTESAGFGIDVDGYYGFQCKDFVDGYSRFLGVPFSNGNAIVLAGDQSGWTHVSAPQPGDVFVKDYVAPNGIDYGHTGAIYQVLSNGVNSIDQNWFNSSLTIGSPPKPVFHPFTDIRGYLRCNNLTGGDMPTQVQVLSAFRQYSLPDPTQAQLDYYSAKPWSVLIEDLFNFVAGNETLDAAAINYGFELGFNRPATDGEIQYWTKKNPGTFLKALYTTRTTK